MGPTLSGGGLTPDVSAKGAALLKKYQGLYVADSNQKTVYFTYDLGYEAGYTADVLNVLQEKDVKALFFICGHYSETEDVLVHRMLAEGHQIGNHTDQHKRAPSLSLAALEKDILDLQGPYEEKYSAKMLFYRPPEGVFDAQTLETAQRLGLHPILWSLAYNDWQRDKTIGREAVVRTIMDRLHNGAIMLFHIASRDVPDALPLLIDNLRSEGYSIGNPTDLLLLSSAS